MSLLAPLPGGTNRSGTVLVTAGAGVNTFNREHPSTDEPDLEAFVHAELRHEKPAFLPFTDKGSCLHEAHRRAKGHALHGQFRHQLTLKASRELCNALRLNSN